MKTFTHEQLYGPEAGPKIDGTPLQVPAGFKKPETMEERLKRFIRFELSEEAARAGADTFEEAMDFDIPDDPVDPSTPFEEFFDPELGRAITPDEMRRFDAEFREQYLRAQGDAIAAEDRAEAIREHVRQLKAKKNNPPGGGGAHPPAPPPQAEN